MSIRWTVLIFGPGAAVSPIFALPYNAMTEQKLSTPEELLQAILLPGQTLTAFTLEKNDELEQSLKENRERQKEALKRKEVDEDLLRQVVKL